MELSKAASPDPLKTDATPPGWNGSTDRVSIDKMAPDAGPEALSPWNWANLAGFVVNLGFTGLTNSGLIGEDNPTLSKKYQTLVTPAPAAFAIWGIIFGGELIFTLAQMTPAFRGSKLVPAVGPFWLSLCISQSLWGIFFAVEMIEVSMFFMICILVSAMGIVVRADMQGCSSFLEYWLLRASFSVHLGWIVAATAVNLNVTLDSQKAAPETMLSLAVTSIVVAFAIGVVFALGVPLPDAIVPLVVSWASFFISQELAEPTFLLDPTRFNPYPWSSIVIDGVASSAYAVSLLAVGISAIAVVLRVRLWVKPDDVKNAEDKETGFEI